MVDRYNVAAQTSGGDPDNVLVLTAHTDSVDAVCLPLLSTFRSLGFTHRISWPMVFLRQIQKPP